MLLSFYTCKEVIERLDAYIDRELSPEETRLVEKHLRWCHQCTRRYRFEESVVTQIRTKLHRIAAPPDLREKILKSLSEEE